MLHLFDASEWDASPNSIEREAAGMQEEPQDLYNNTRPLHVQAQLLTRRTTMHAHRYPNAEVFWVQEEPQNMGAWGYVQPRIATALKDVNGKEATFVGRNAAAAPATGTPAIHQVSASAANAVMVHFQVLTSDCQCATGCVSTCHV